MLWNTDQSDMDHETGNNLAHLLTSTLLVSLAGASKDSSREAVVVQEF